MDNTVIIQFFLALQLLTGSQDIYLDGRKKISLNWYALSIYHGFSATSFKSMPGCEFNSVIENVCLSLHILPLRYQKNQITLPHWIHYFPFKCVKNIIKYILQLVPIAISYKIFHQVFSDDLLFYYPFHKQNIRWTILSILHLLITKEKFVFVIFAFLI